MPVVQIVKPRKGLGHVSKKLVSKSSGTLDNGDGGRDVCRSASVVVSTGLAGRSFTPGTYRFVMRSGILEEPINNTFFDLFTRRVIRQDTNGVSCYA